MEILSFNNVNLTYQTIESETEALKNLSFSVADGEFVALVGPSGCGKTTILSLSAGLIKPTSGAVVLAGKTVDRPCGDVGYMLQRDYLFEWRSIADNVTLGLEIQKQTGDDKREYALDMLDKYGLKDFKKHYPNQLSGGMRQRAALIRTLAFRPKLLLLDEPFSAIDFQTRMAVCDDIHSIIKREKKTAILVTHDISEALSMADKIIILTKRPATVKREIIVDLKGSTPLKRREDSLFTKWFDTVWKEVTDYDQTSSV